MDRGRSPDPEAGLYYAQRRRRPSLDNHNSSKHTQDPSKYGKRWNLKVFMFHRYRAVLMVVAFLAFTMGGSRVMSLLNPPPGAAGSASSSGEGQQFVATADDVDVGEAQHTPRQQEAGAVGEKRATWGGRKRRGQAHTVQEEEEEGVWEEELDLLEEGEEEEEEGEEGEEEEEEEGEEDYVDASHIAALADKLRPAAPLPGANPGFPLQDLKDLDPQTKELIRNTAMEKMRQRKGILNNNKAKNLNLAATAQEAADQIRAAQDLQMQQQQGENPAPPPPPPPPKHPDPRDPSLPTHADAAIAHAQSKLEGRTAEEHTHLNSERKTAVKAAIMHSWDGYKQFAWGHDELAPVSKKGLKWFGLGLTIVDTLDLLWLIDEKDEFQGARDWVATELNPSLDVHVNVFEVTIRVMGGLLSAYHYSNDEVFLTKAKELAHNLRPAMESPSGVPWSDAVLASRHAFAPASATDSSVSEAASIQLEFKYIAHLLEDEGLYRLAEGSMRAIDESRRRDLPEGSMRALVPMFINADTGHFNRGSTITLGARGDSYYEYLLKQWLLTHKQEDFYKELYMESVAAIKDKLFRHTEGQGLAYIAELQSGGAKFSPKMDHLVCYLPGTLALGVHHGLDDADTHTHLQMAKELMVTCFEFYNSTATGLSPEIAYFHTESRGGNGGADLYIQPRDTHNILRPETVESLFYLYRVTKDPIYQEWAWQIFSAFELYAKMPDGGYSGLQNVDSFESERIDKMESFWLGETLKYLYLIFSDESVLSLDEYVLNTEAHPFPFIQPKEEWMVYKEKIEEIKAQQEQEGGEEKEKEKEGEQGGQEEVAQQQEGGQEEVVPAPAPPPPPAQEVEEVGEAMLKEGGGGGGEGGEITAAVRRLLAKEAKEVEEAWEREEEEEVKWEEEEGEEEDVEDEKEGFEEI